MFRCAVYARFSSDLQRETSIDDQIAVARRYAEQLGWIVLEPHIYRDAGFSGASLDRPGWQAFLRAAAQVPRPFDVLLVDDSSRVSRDLPDALRVLQELRFHGIRVVYISQQIDSVSEQAETLITVHGLVDGLYLKEARAKIKRGLRGQLERGFATGAITFGYRTVPVPDPSGKTDVNGYPLLLGKRHEVVPEEARTIVLIYEWYATGLGAARLVERLNKEGHRGPRGRRWREGAVKRVLANEKYRGLLIWGKKRMERRPGTRHHVERPNPRDEWHTVERPELRIVSDDLWERVQARRAAVKGTLHLDPRLRLMRGKNAALHSPHLFSGFMTCGTCGGTVVIVTGGYGSPRYGCLRSWRNGADLCPNRLTIRAKIADRYLLEGLKTELLAPSTLTLITGLLADALQERIDQRPRLLAEARTAREQAHQRLQRLIEAIENGVAPSTVAAAIAGRQAELAHLDATLAELAEPLQHRLAVMPTWVRQQLEDLVGVLSDTPERTKAEFQRAGLRITMTPRKGDDGRRYYQADVVKSMPWLADRTEMRIPSASAVDRSHPRAADSRTPGALRFRVDLPANHLGPGWKTRVG